MTDERRLRAEDRRRNGGDREIRVSGYGDQDGRPADAKPMDEASIKNQASRIENIEYRTQNTVAQAILSGKYRKQEHKCIGA